MTLTAERLRELVNYNPDTGVFTWAKKTGRKSAVGKQVGSLHTPSTGYSRMIMCIEKKKYFGHRLAWLYVYGEWPETDVDHINGDATDNRIVNLRLATKTQNHANSKRYKNNKSGFKGVHWCGLRGMWRASIRKDGRNIHLGHFEDAAEAGNAYKYAAVHLFGEFACDGRGH